MIFCAVDCPTPGKFSSSPTSAELERVLAGAAEGTVLPLAWMLLARLCAEQGKHARAAELLEQVAAVVPEEKGVQEFLAVMRQKATAVG